MVSLIRLTYHVVLESGLDLNMRHDTEASLLRRLQMDTVLCYLQQSRHVQGVRDDYDTDDTNVKGVAALR